MNFTGLKIGLCALLAVISVTANASVSWNFKTLNNGDFRVSSSTADTYQFTGDDLSTVTTLSAWSSSVSLKTIKNIDNLLAHNQHGLVIDQDGYGADGAGYGLGGNDAHQIDNGGNYEFVMFDFGDKEFSLDTFNIGWSSSDTDVTVMAYQEVTGMLPAKDIADKNLSDIDTTNGWSVISHHSNAGTGSESVNSNLASVYSSYWIIGAYMSAVGTGGDSIGDSSWDDIKLAGISGRVRSTSPPTSDVPEPGTLVLTALGLAFITRKKLAANK